MDYFSYKAQFHFNQDTLVTFCSFGSDCAEALQAAGMGLEETSQVLEWLSSTQTLVVVSDSHPVPAAAATKIVHKTPRTVNAAKLLELVRNSTCSS